MNNSMGDAMAAHAKDRSIRYQSVQQDTTLGFPIQVPRPDGEERYPSKKPHNTPDQVSQEIYYDFFFFMTVWQKIDFYKQVDAVCWGAFKL